MQYFHVFYNKKKKKKEKKIFQLFHSLIKSNFKKQNLKLTIFQIREKNVKQLKITSPNFVCTKNKFQKISSNGFIFEP